MKKKRFTLTTEVFKPINSETTESDRKSILAIQEALREKKKKYVYMEIGSYKGGSLQPFMADPYCSKIYSIDSRVATKMDERGEMDFYPSNSEEIMFKNLNKYYKDSVFKVVSLRKNSSEVQQSDIKERVDISFIDAEHTDTAAYRDFLLCMQVAAKQAVILFHDANMIVEGFNKSLEYLKRRSVQYNAYVLPTTLGVVEIGGIELYKHPKVIERFRDSFQAYVFGMRRFMVYRDFYKKFIKNPVFSFFIRGTARLQTLDLQDK